jgi:hypothetical protein
MIRYFVLRMWKGAVKIPANGVFRKWAEEKSRFYAFSSLTGPIPKFQGNLDELMGWKKKPRLQLVEATSRGEIMLGRKKKLFIQSREKRCLAGRLK